MVNTISELNKNSTHPCTCVTHPTPFFLPLSQDYCEDSAQAVSNSLLSAWSFTRLEFSLNQTPCVRLTDQC